MPKKTFWDTPGNTLESLSSTYQESWKQTQQESETTWMSLRVGPKAPVFWTTPEEGAKAGIPYRNYNQFGKPEWQDAVDRDYRWESESCLGVRLKKRMKRANEQRSFGQQIGMPLPGEQIELTNKHGEKKFIRVEYLDWVPGRATGKIYIKP
jgi:hypothetical protein